MIQLIGRSLLTLLVTLTLIAPVFAQQVNIEFSGWPNKDRMEPLLARFHEENPDIHVELTLEGADEVKTRIAGGVPPEIFRVSWAQLADFADTGAAIDLQPFIDRDRQDLHMDDFWPPTIESGRYKGKQYGMPMNVGGNLTFVNLDHINQAGLSIDADWTFDDFADISQRTTRDVNGDGTPDIWGFADTTKWSFWTGLIYSNGGSIYNESETEFTMDTPVVVDAIRYIEDLVNRRNAAAPPGADSTSFPSGGRTFWLTSAPWVFRMGDVPFDWTVMPNPRGSERRVMMGGNQPLLISKTASPEQQEAAWRLIKFIARPDIQAWFGNMGWNAPTRISAIPLVENEHIRTYARQLENQQQHTNRLFGQINSAFNGHLEAVLAGHESPESAAAQIDHELDVELDNALAR